MKSFPTVKVIAGALMAYRENNNKIIREEYYETVDEVRVTHFANKSLIVKLLKEDNFNDTILAEASEVIVFLQHQSVLQTLLGKQQNSFLCKIAEDIKEEIIKQNSIGLMAWAPHVYTNLINSENRREAWSMYSPSSKFIAKVVGEKVECTFKLIDKRYVKRFECWSVIGVTDDGDIVSYFCNNENKIIEQGKIQGRVKDLNIDRFRNNAKVTCLNYVKAVK